MEAKKIIAKYLPTKVHDSIPDFLKHRQLKLIFGSVAKRKAQKVIKGENNSFLSSDIFTKVIQMDGYVVIEAADLPEKKRRYHKNVSKINRDRPTKTFVIIIDMNSKYAAQSPEFVNLMKRVPGFDYEKRDYNVDIIIITKGSLSSHIRKKIKIYQNNGTDKAGFTHIYTYQYYAFNANIMDPKNAFVAKHEIMSHELELELLKQLNASKKDLPRIHQSDTPIIWIGAEIGDIVKITYSSESAGEEIEYRTVIPPRNLF